MPGLVSLFEVVFPRCRVRPIQSLMVFRKSLLLLTGAILAWATLTPTILPRTMRAMEATMPVGIRSFLRRSKMSTFCRSVNELGRRTLSPLMPLNFRTSCCCLRSRWLPAWSSKRTCMLSSPKRLAVCEIRHGMLQLSSIASRRWRSTSTPTTTARQLLEVTRDTILSTRSDRVVIGVVFVCEKVPSRERPVDRRGNDRLQGKHIYEAVPAR